MSKFANIAFKFFFLVIIIFPAIIFSNVACEYKTFVEVEREQDLHQAPKECLDELRVLVEYLKSGQNDIVTDKTAQNRFLSAELKELFIKHINHSEKGERTCDFPSNQTFLNVWNAPTTYSIVGSRQYDFHNKKNQNLNVAIVDVLYEWSEYSDGINNQYPGNKSLHTYIFVFEENKWKLDDVYTYDGEFTPTSSLKNYLQGSQ
jgi:hypothetical protein